MFKAEASLKHSNWCIFWGEWRGGAQSHTISIFYMLPISNYQDLHQEKGRWVWVCVFIWVCHRVLIAGLRFCGEGLIWHEESLWKHRAGYLHSGYSLLLRCQHSLRTHVKAIYKMGLGVNKPHQWRRRKKKTLLEPSSSLCWLNGKHINTSFLIRSAISGSITHLSNEILLFRTPSHTHARTHIHTCFLCLSIIIFIIRNQ